MNKRLATSIRPVSYWRVLYIVAYILVLLGVVLTMALSWWMMVVTLMTNLVVFVIIIGRRVQPIHISAPTLANQMIHWQLLYVGRSKNELWEAKLVDIKNYGNCIQLIFYTVHPILTHRHIVIWQDQVEGESWRQLKVWARWM